MNITVFGASGGIGGHVTALAAQRGHHVRAVYRQAPVAPPAGAETVIAPDVFELPRSSRSSPGQSTAAWHTGHDGQHCGRIRSSAAYAPVWNSTR